MIKKLNDFKTLPKGERLKKDFDFLDLDDLHIINTIKNNLGEGIAYTAGESPKFTTLYNETKEEIEQLFGLPYTSGNSANIGGEVVEFSAIWNTNTQAETINLDKKLYFEGGAITETRKSVLIFKDNKEAFYYFVDYDFYNFNKQEKERHKAIKAEQDTKNANILTNKIIGILNANAGKKYGPKTSETIHNEIRETAQLFGLSAYLTTDARIFGGAPYCYLTIEGKQQGRKFWRPFDFLTEENTIKTPEEIKPFKEFNGQKHFTERDKLAENIQTQAAKFLDLLEQYNEINQDLGKEDKDTETGRANVYILAKYGINNIPKYYRGNK